MKNLVKKCAVWFVVIASIVAVTVGATQAVNARNDRLTEIEITEAKKAERHTRIHNMLVDADDDLIRVFEVTEDGFGEIVDSRYYFVNIGDGKLIETEVR